jgi:hypothetical protein
MIEAIAVMSAALSDLASIAGAASAPSSAALVPDPTTVDGASGPSFMQTLQNALNGVDNTVATADTNAAGSPPATRASRSAT